jgi:hypothetical protein
LRIEARFHPPRIQQRGYVTVGYVVWDAGGTGKEPRIEPASSLVQISAPQTLLVTLRHLVRVNRRRFGGLPFAPSPYWSFVVVPPDADAG